MNNPNHIGQAVKEERDARSWSQSELARKLRVPEGTIRRWEKGKSAPNHAMFERICELFGWPLPYSVDSTKASYTSPLLMEELALAQMA